jgi:hypothetical protein
MVWKVLALKRIARLSLNSRKLLRTMAFLQIMFLTLCCASQSLNPAPEYSRNVVLELFGNQCHGFATLTGFLSFHPLSPLTYLWQHKPWVLSSFGLVLLTCTFLPTKSVWALGAKLGFGNVRQSKGILATRRVDMVSTIVLYVLQGVLQVASIVFTIDFVCVVFYVCFFVLLNCYLIVHVCVNLHLSTFPQ